MLPFSDLRVIDLSRVLAGPYCCAMLADLGAEVIKVERPGAGDENRAWGHIWHGTGFDFLNVNRSKRDITVDLSRQEGRDLIKELVKSADVLVENFVPGRLRRMGLDYEVLSAINPRLIYCSISAYGEAGPLGEKPGYDGALQAFSGHMMITGDAASGPARSGASVIDMSTGIAAYGAVLTALFARQQTGRGQKISLSLLKTALALMGTHGAANLNAGIEPKRAGAGVSHLAPYGAYRTRDACIVIGALSEHAWRNLCLTLDLADLPTDPRFHTMQARLEHRQELDKILNGALAARTTDDWVPILEKAGLVCSPLNSLSQALAHPQVEANGMIETLDTAQGALRLVGLPMDFSDIAPDLQAPPMLGEHTDAVLREIGFDETQIAHLRHEGVI